MAKQTRRKRHPLREWRRAQSPWWSQHYLAQRAGVPVWAVAKIETGVPVADHHVAALESFTGVPIRAAAGPTSQLRSPRPYLASPAAAINPDRRQA